MKHLERKVRFWILITVTKKTYETNTILYVDEKHFFPTASKCLTLLVPVFRRGICYKCCAVCDIIHDPWNKLWLTVWHEAQHKNAAVANESATQ